MEWVCLETYMEIERREGVQSAKEGRVMSERCWAEMVMVWEELLMPPEEVEAAVVGAARAGSSGMKAARNRETMSRRFRVRGILALIGRGVLRRLFLLEYIL